jgi:mono/diheme cytochrome c family protein
MFCHSRAAGFVLGLTTPQMNRDHDYAGAKANQLLNFAQLGIFKKPLSKLPSAYISYPDPANPKADLASRVKTYFQVNCAMCHVSDGGGNSLIELSYKTPLQKARMLNEPPLHDDFGITGARLVAPGDPERSLLYQRIARRGEGQMPPTSTNLVDHAGARLISEWIRKLPAK